MYINHFCIYTDNFLGYRAAYDTEVSSFRVHRVLCRSSWLCRAPHATCPTGMSGPISEHPLLTPIKVKNCKKTFNAAVISQSPGK